MKTFLLDVCCTDESTHDIANAMTHSLKRIFPDDAAVRIYGQCIDSGGDGTKIALEKAMRKLDLDGSFYLTSTCALHNL